MVLKKNKSIKIDILMIGSEYDLDFFAKKKKIIERKTDCLVCVSNPNTVKISEDKFLTQKFLIDNELSYLKTLKPTPS